MRSKGSIRSWSRVSPTRDVERLLTDPGIVRNRAKIESAISNAGCVLAVQEEARSFDCIPVGVRRRCADRHSLAVAGPSCRPRPPSRALLSKDLKRRGFRFVGPTTCYAFMQAVGMVNDHTMECFRYEEVSS